MENRDLVYLEARAFWEGDGRLGVEITRGKERRQIFFPKAHVCDESEVWERGQSGKLVIPLWLAERLKITYLALK